MKSLIENLTKEELKKVLDKKWKEASLVEYGNLCEICREPMSAYHHFVPKSRSTLLKFDILNSVPLCKKHHYIIHFDIDPTKRADVVKIFVVGLKLSVNRRAKSAGAKDCINFGSCWRSSREVALA